MGTVQVSTVLVSAAPPQYLAQSLRFTGKIGGIELTLGGVNRPDLEIECARVGDDIVSMALSRQRSSISSKES